MRSRELIFQGSYNTRDLGGLPIGSGEFTRWRSLIRSDEIDQFTLRDWETLSQIGVRTVIDLRNLDEVHREDWPADFHRVQIPLDGGDDPAFWKLWKDTGKWCTPLYYEAHLKRFPELTARVIMEIATSESHGVLFHCGAGRDRTGLISMVLLNLAGVAHEDIAADHCLSHDRLSRRHKMRGEMEERPFIEKVMRESGKTVCEVIRDTLTQVDVEDLLLANGCSQADLAAVRTRLRVYAHTE